MAEESKKGIHRKIEDLKSGCPPKHYNTDAYTLVNYETCGAKKIEFFLTEIHPGGYTDSDIHEGQEHAYFMLSGVAEAEVEGEKFILRPAELLYIPPGASHKIKPIGGQTIRFCVFMAPGRSGK